MTYFGRALVLLALASTLLSAGVQAEIEARIDRAVISVDDTLTLSIRATAGEDLDAANLSVLERDFEILHRSRNSRTTIRNGQRSSESELELSLAPRRSGQLQIPPIRVGGQSTRPLPIGVNEARRDLSNAEQVFLEAEVDRSEVYVQSQLIYTLRLYQSINLAEVQRSDLPVDHARIEELDTQRFQRNINGTTYLVTELRFALFPEESGDLQIPGITITATEASSRRSLFDRGRQLRRRSQPLSVQVLPIPAEFPSRNWLPSSEVTISEDWSADPESIKIGESVTRTITLRAAGVSAAQISPFEFVDIEGLKIYPDQPSREEIRDEGGITAMTVQSSALLATRGGDFTLPELRIPWWDTATGQLRHAVLPARTMSVLAPAMVTTPTVAESPVPGQQSISAAAPATNNLWMWTTLAALLGWALSTVLILRYRRQPAASGATARSDSEISESRQFKQLLEACRGNQAIQARALLLKWGNTFIDSSSDQPGVSRQHELLDLRSLGVQLDDTSLNSLLYQLDQSLYSEHPAQWRGAKLAEELKLWRDRHRRQPRDTAALELPALYG